MGARASPSRAGAQSVSLIGGRFVDELYMAAILPGEHPADPA
jgi:hypothetical protein